MLQLKTVVATGALLLAATSAQAALTDLVSNGGFESGDFSGWQSNAFGITASNPSSGTYSASLLTNSPVGSGIKQNLGAGLLTAGQSVTISFDYRGTASLGGVLFTELHSIDGVGGVSQSELLSGGPLFPNADPSVWTSYSLTTNIGPDVDGGIDLLITAQCGADAGCLSDYFIDNVSVTANVVPVPAAAWLFGSALFGLTVMRKRQA